MRLDKLLSSAGVATRKESALAAKRGQITVDGVPVRDVSVHVDPGTAAVVFCGRPVLYRRYVYLMLHKPEGYVSATEDTKLPVVTELLPQEYRRLSLFPVGRLDRDTTGMMILTNDGPLAHAVLSPRRHVEKVYRFTAAEPLADGAEERFAGNITLADGYECKSARLVADPDRMGGEITLTEGKYHQIKRMIAATGNRVTSLSRLSFAGIPLDPALPPGAWRELTPEEIGLLRSKM